MLNFIFTFLIELVIYLRKTVLFIKKKPTLFHLLKKNE